MNERIEELRKKVWAFYGGVEGVQQVDMVVQNAKVEEDMLSSEKEEAVLKEIVQKVFVDKFGREKAKKILQTRIGHVRGYDSQREGGYEAPEKPKFKRFMDFKKIIAIVLILALFALAAAFWFYVSTFDPLSKCLSQPDEVRKDQCIILIAVSKRNISLCEEVESKDIYFNCVSSVAVLENDTSLCPDVPENQIDSQKYETYCLYCIAYKLKNQRLCETLPNSLIAGECAKDINRGYSAKCSSYI